MSEPRLISPLLDNFIMGDPISDHNGIRCCPAMDTVTDDKYIVKIISFPSSQTQLDALLLANAFENEEAANGYFESRAKELAKEVEFLQTISRQEGFIPYKGFQIVPKEDSTGYDVYLLAEYKRSIERHSAKRPFTHLDALNLGLDICSAFSACRRSGYLFVNLKPSNVYVTPNGEYKIGDLGFIKLSSLKYASMPENYISAYTAPEIQDPFASLNESIDVFSLGAMLYQIYNGGELPDFTEDYLPAPKYADEEITSIILKACSLSPEDRWTDPAQMGQMLVSYMQKNGASDTPIVPIVVEETISDPEETITTTEDEQCVTPAESEVTCSVEDDSADKSDSVIAEIADNVANPVVDTEVSAQLSTSSEELSEEAQIGAMTENSESEADSVTTEEAQDEMIADATALLIDDPQLNDSEVISEESDEDVVSAPIADDGKNAETSQYGIDESVIASIIAIDSANSDSSSTDELDSDDIESNNTSYDDISDEVSMILAHADELAAMEVPEPVVAPEPAEITIPTSENPREAYASPSAEEYADPTAGDKDLTDIKRLIDEDDDHEVDNQTQDEYEYFYSAYPPKRRIGKYIVIGIILLSLLIGGFLFYKFYVVQTINALSVTGSNDHMIVTLDTKTDNSLLSIICTDIYGTPVSVPVVDGKASFSGLMPDTEYSIAVEISGLHVLNGDTTASYFTPQKTSIVQHTVVTGNTKGSVILSFTVSGPDSEKWFFTYSAPGVTAETVAFTGHTVTLSNLLEGKVYTGTLEPEDDLFIKDKMEISFTSSDVIQATNLTVTSCMDGKLTAKWNAPEGAEISGWTVRCTNGSDYDATVTTDKTFVEFTDLDHTDSFTIEVTAVGQSVSQRTSVGENTVTVTDFKADSQTAGIITLSWNSQITPESGWIISYTVNGTPFTKTVAGEQNHVVINPAVPGSDYQFMIQSADAESTVFEPCSYTTAAAKDFSGFQVSKDNLRFNMCLRPESGSWDYTDVEEFTNTFSPGALAGFVVHVNRVYGVSYEDVTTAFVIYDESNKIVSIHSSTNAWTYMWYKNYCELNIPAIPQEAGNYTIHVYFNGQLANIQSFSVE